MMMMMAAMVMVRYIFAHRLVGVDIAPKELEKCELPHVEYMPAIFCHAQIYCFEFNVVRC